MSLPPSRPSPELFSLADAAHAAQQPVEAVQEYLGGPHAPGALNEAELVAVLQHFGRLPAGDTQGYWLTYEHLGMATNRRPGYILKVLSVQRPVEFKDRKNLAQPGGGATHYFKTQLLIWLLEYYNFLPSPEFHEFSATVFTVARALDAKLGRPAYSMSQLCVVLRRLPIEHRVFRRPELTRGKPLNCFRPHEVLPLMYAKLEEREAR